ncbi:oligosaccharide flippase family protein [Cellvibrio sp. OA-2007]|uniref:oligosaccharide flippase family protein n=1 Tax=Cellvibrio sp. OA-2007 TaxID=529823 RepID=UPI0007813129|nr:oligosaccharide flippase family protein [Cellvibrio sp. OA-2007]
MSLQKSLGSSAAWMSLAASSMSIVSFVVFIIISRILSPDEIGLVVFAILVVEAGRIIINGGLSISIVQRPEWEEDYAATSFYISCCYGVIVTLIVLFIGVPLTAKLYAPAAASILAVLSIIFMLEAIKVVHDGKLRRDLRFKAIAIRSILSSVISSIIGIYLALHGYGVWALVAQQLSGQLIVTALTIIGANWWPRWQFSLQRAGEAIHMASPMMLAQFINTLCSTLVEFMVGIILGPIALGIYRIAGRALFILQEIIIRPLEQTTIPVLARMENAQARAKATLRILRINSFVILPIFFGTAAIAEEFIALVFGEKWHSSGALMALLALGSTPFALRIQINATLTAEGKSRWVLLNMIATLLTTLIIGYLLIPYGTHYAAIAYVVINYISGAISMVIFQHIFRCGFIPMLNVLWPSHLAASIMLCICLAVKQWLPQTLPAATQLLLLGATGGISYFFLCVVIFRNETRNFLGECLKIMPLKFSPLLLRIQSWARLN